MKRFHVHGDTGMGTRPFVREFLRVGAVVSLLLMMGAWGVPGPARGSHDFTFHGIASGTGADNAQAVTPVDFDGDGDRDVVAATRSDTVAWFERSDADPTVFIQHVIDSGVSIDVARDVEPADVDGDGDVDVVTASFAVNSTFAWYEQDDNDSTAFTRHVIATRSHIGEDIDPVDFDSDGDVDVVTAARSTVAPDTFAWYEQDDADSTVFRRRVIDTGITVKVPRDIDPVDINRDEALDVVTASQADTFAWYENDGTNTSFTRHVIASGTPADGAEDVDPVDMDGDGDPDVVTAARFQDEFAWYEQDDADPTVFRRHVIDSGANAAQKTDPSDVDGDGDSDVMGVSAGDLAWYEQDDADSTVFTRHGIDTGSNADFATDISAGDVDGDGSLDAVTAAGDTFAWYENPLSGTLPGGGGFGDGGSCLIERSGLSSGRLEALRGLRDAVLKNAWGRYFTTRYYAWFEVTDG